MAIELKTTDPTRESLLDMFQPLPADCKLKRQQIGYLLDDIILATRTGDPHTNAAAWYLRGRIWTLYTPRKQSIEQVRSLVAEAVLERVKIEQAADADVETIEQWMASLDPVGLPLALFPDAPTALELTAARARREYPSRQQLLDEEPEPPEPTTPASAPKPQAEEMAEATGLALYDAWESQVAAARYEQEQAFWRDYNANRQQIAMETGCRVDAMAMGLDVMDEDVQGWLEEEAAEWERSLEAVA